MNISILSKCWHPSNLTILPYYKYGLGDIIESFIMLAL